MESCACCLTAEEAGEVLTRACASMQTQPPSSASQIDAYFLATRASVRLSDLGVLLPPRQIYSTSCGARALMAAVFFEESFGL